MKRIILFAFLCICSLTMMGGRPHRVYKRPPYQYHLDAAYKQIKEGNYSAASDSIMLIKSWTNERVKDIDINIPETEGYLAYLEEHPLPAKVQKKFLKRYVSIVHLNFVLEFYVEALLAPFTGWYWRSDEDLSLSDFTYERSLSYSTRTKIYHKIRRVRNLENDLTLSHGFYAIEEMDEEAIPYIQKAYSLSKDIASADNLYRSTFAFYLGDMALQRGDFAKAEQYLNEATLSKNREIKTISHRRLGDMNRDFRYFEQAEYHYREALKCNKKFGRVSILQNLAFLSYRKGDFEQASHYLTRAKKAQLRSEHVYSKVHDIHITDTIGYSEVTNPYYICALMYFYNKSSDLESAMRAQLEYGVSAKSTHVTNAYNLGNMYYLQRKYVSAYRFMQKAQKSAQAMNGDSCPEYPLILQRLIQIYDAMNFPRSAEPYVYESFDVNKKRFVSSVSFLSEQQRAKYWNTLYSGFQDLYPFFVYKHHERFPKLREFAYDNELFTKGLLLTSSNAVQQSVQESGDSTLIAQWEQFTTLKQAIMALQEKSPDTVLIEQYEKRAEELEKIITVNSAAYRENIQQWSITWDSVRKALKPKQVAIEYMSAPINKDSTMYCALLLRDTCSQPILIPLFEQKEVDSLLERYTDTVYLAIRRIYAYDERGKALSERIWNNVKPYLNTGDTVYFSATGVLHQIAIENLWCDSTHTMADTYTMVRLSSTRELAIARQPIVHQTATIYGGIPYTITPETVVKEYSEHPEYTQKTQNLLAYSPTRGGKLNFGSELPATKQEMYAIEAILKKQHVKVTTYSGLRANEESFKNLSGKQQNIVHLATHGFYAPDSTDRNPLEKCGLYFMGVNNLVNGDFKQIQSQNPYIEDGLVTAKDISLMDFRQADIVVLSACETGLGDVTGEGVFGLQRAFKMAGAQTLIMSLWHVDDRATQMLMTAFYRYLYSPNMTKHQAFRAAQQEVRNSGFESPYYWAGFILLD